MHPADGRAGLSPQEIQERSDEFLSEDLDRRLAVGPANYDIQVQIAAKGDPVTDPTTAWPEEREKVKVGTLTVSRSTGQECDRIMFSPLALPDGIEPSDDPILRIRTAVYGVSLSRRQ